MGSASATSCAALALALLLALLVGSVRSNVDQDRAECADQVVGLATCLPYVGGQAKAPTPDCCSGLKLVLQKSKKCLCVLIKDRDDPSLGLKVNLTLALGLPTACHAPADITECVGILHLPPNSPAAKEFLGLKNSTSGASTAPATPESGNSTKSGENPEGKSDGGMRKQWLGMEIFIWLFTSSLLLSCI